MNSSFDIGMKIRVENTRCTRQEISGCFQTGCYAPGYNRNDENTDVFDTDMALHLVRCHRIRQVQELNAA